MQQQRESRPIEDFAFYELLCYKFERRRLVADSPDNDKIPLLIERLKSIPDWTDVVLKLLFTSARVVDEVAKENTDFSKEFHGWMLDFLLKVYAKESGDDVVNADGISVLHIACTRPEVEFVERLLEEKADVNRQVPHSSNSKFAGYTPLHFAVYNGNHEVAEFLLKRSARIYEHDLNGSTPLHVACYRRDSKMIDLILTHDRVPANVVDSNGLSHFMIACTSNEPAFAKEYLRVADCQSSTSSAKILISSRARNIVDGQFAGYTPLHFAAEFGSAEVFELLLARGARCCAVTDRMFTPLMLAHKHGHEQIVPRVFECRCDRDEMRQVDVDEVLDEGGDDVTIVFEKSVRDENALVCVDGEESGYVSERESVKMNVVSEKSVVVSGDGEVEKVARTAKSLETRGARESHTNGGLTEKSGSDERTDANISICVDSRKHGSVSEVQSVQIIDIEEDDEDVTVVFEKSVRDEKADENALVCVDGEESGYVSEKESVKMNVVSKKSVEVSASDSVGNVIEFVTALGLCPVTRERARESETDSVQVPSRKRNRKTVCHLACCDPNSARRKRFREV